MQAFEWDDEESIQMVLKEGLKVTRKPERIIHDNIRYKGEWSGAIRHGKGTQIWPDGTRYDGFFVNDE